MSAPVPSVVPPLTAPRRAAQAHARPSATLPNGLRGVAVRKPGVPLVEIRLRVPVPDRPHRAIPARAALLVRRRSHRHRGARPDRHRRGRAGARRRAVGRRRRRPAARQRQRRSPRTCAPLLALLAERAHRRPPIPRTRWAPNATGSSRSSRSPGRSPGVIAARGAGRGACGAITRTRASCPQPRPWPRRPQRSCAGCTAELVRPDGAMLVLVGDVSPARALDQSSRALGSWTGSPPRRRVPPLPEPEPGPLLIVDRPGSVQSSAAPGRLRGGAHRRPTTRRCSWRT